MQNVRYSEFHLDVGTHLENGVEPEGLRQALAAAARDGERRHGVRVRLVASLTDGVERPEQILDWALADRELIVAVGLRSSTGFDDPRREIFEQAGEAGLHRVVSLPAGAGSEAIRAMLDDGRPERVGHGARAVEDPALVEDLAAHGPALALCPTAEVRVGSWDELADHPFETLRQTGVALSVGSAGAPLYDTNLTREYARLYRAFGYPPAVLAALAVAAVDHSFLGDEEKAAMREELRREFRRLGERYLDGAVELAASSEWWLGGTGAQ